MHIFSTGTRPALWLPAVVLAHTLVARFMEPVCWIPGTSQADLYVYLPDMNASMMKDRREGGRRSIVL